MILGAEMRLWPAGCLPECLPPQLPQLATSPAAAPPLACYSSKATQPSTTVSLSHSNIKSLIFSLATL